MSVNEKMTAIANAIRERTGNSGTLSLDKMVLEIDNIKAKTAQGEISLPSQNYTVEIDISEIGFKPDLAMVYLVDEEIDYGTMSPTKMWVVLDAPELNQFMKPGVSSDNKYSVFSNLAMLGIGTKGSCSLSVASANTMFIGEKKENGKMKMVIKVGQRSSSNPILQGTYKWIAYKFGG